MQAALGKERCTLFQRKSLRWRFALSSFVPFFLIASITIQCGCSHLRLPAIDPQGSCLFLPHPSSTQLLVPHLHARNGQPGIIPEPAFATPPTPPPCLDASNAGVCNHFGSKHHLIDKLQTHFNVRGKAGEIQLTPTRIVAPVGGEVVLLSGICGPDGYLVKREPLEWMLSPDSVGTFIEVGDDRPGKLSNFFHRDPKIEKLDVDFAKGRTSSKRTLITRGTPNCDDDIELREGQTWLSISSPSEGVSRITVLAPDSEIWDRRRQTATIYWVDAQWEFPSPVIRRTGEAVPLVTRVTMAENLVPAEGWIVEYTILDPGIASFISPDGSPLAGSKNQVRVNADGQAIAAVASTPEGRGTTPILIDVIRPAQPSDSLPQLILGRGQTTVTFSAPGLNLEAFGPSQGSIGEQLTYSAVLGNPGDIGAENVQLRVQIPAGTRYVAAVPQPSTLTPGHLIWDQGALPANSQLDVSVVLEALQTNTVSVLFQAQGSGFPLRERRVTTEIIEASVDVRFAPTDGKAEASVGSVVEYEIDVTNSGRQTLTDLNLEIESDPGLPEYYQGENRVEQVISVLQPGETRPIGVTFQIQQTGQLAARLRIRSGEQILAEKSTSIRGLPEQAKEPKVEVSIDFPDTVRTGASNTAVISLRNSGEVKLTEVQVEIAIDPSLAARQVDSVNASRVRLSDDRLQLTWSAQDLLPRLPGDAGDIVRRLWIEFESRAEVTQGRIAASVTTAQGVQTQTTKSFQSRGLQSPSPVIPPGSSAPGGQVTPPSDTKQRTGRLQVQLEDYDDPTVVGRELRYNLFVINDRDVTDRNVQVLLRKPEGVDVLRITQEGNPVNYRFLQDGTISLPSIQFIRPDERIIYFLVVIPKVPQLMTLQAQTYSDGQPEPFEVSESTQVNLP